jgi:hypothetical protein
MDENPEFVNNLHCRESLQMTVDFYKRIGFSPPWIGYYVMENEMLVGSAAFKGKPVNGQIEIAYGTFEEFRKQGVGTKICKILVNLSYEQIQPSGLLPGRCLRITIQPGSFRKTNFTL